MAAKIVTELAASLANDIQRGQWAVGQRLPSVRDMARQASVSINTIQAALRTLENQGLIECQPRRGNYVRQINSQSQAITTTPNQNNVPSPDSSNATATQIGFVRYFTPGVAHGAPEVLAQRDSWGDNILHGVEQTLNESSYQLTLLTSMGKEDWIEKLLHRIKQLNHQLAGVVLYAMPGIEKIIDELDRMAIPWVTINRFAQHQTHNFVCTDYRDAGLCTGKLFQAMGCQNVVVLGVNIDQSVSSMDRALGVAQAWLTAGKSASNIHLLNCKDWFETSALEAMEDFLANHQPPQAVFTSGDFQCFGVLEACRRHGLRIPEDVALVGSSGLELSKFTQPTLSLVQQPMLQIGQEAAGCLVHMIQHRQLRIPGRLLPGRLVLRGSTLVTQAHAQSATTSRTKVIFDQNKPTP